MQKITGRYQLVLLSILVIVVAVVVLLSQTTVPSNPSKDRVDGTEDEIAGAVHTPDRLGAQGDGGDEVGEDGAGEGPSAWTEPQRATAETGAFGEQRPTRCAGTIRDPQGVPIEGAKIIVFEPALYGPGGTIVAETETGADGTYVLMLVPRDTLKIGASVEGYQDTRELLNRGPLEARDFVLRSLEE